MSRIPTLVALAISIGIACSAQEESVDGADEVGSLPFAPASLETGSFPLVNEAGDTLRFVVSRERGRARIARYRNGVGGRDSLIAVVNDDDYTPIRSYQLIHREDGTITAEVLYGRGFDGQARLFLTAPDGRRETNIRTPEPTLDAGQVAMTLRGLDLAAGNTVSFNFVAPFEERAIPARAEVGRPRTIEASGAEVEAMPVHVRVSGLEERYWYSIDPPHDLLRLEELTRGTVWTRP